MSALTKEMKQIIVSMQGNWQRLSHDNLEIGMSNIWGVAVARAMVTTIDVVHIITFAADKFRIEEIGPVSYLNEFAINSSSVQSSYAGKLYTESCYLDDDSSLVIHRIETNGSCEIVERRSMNDDTLQLDITFLNLQDGISVTATCMFMDLGTSITRISNQQFNCLRNPQSSLHVSAAPKEKPTKGLKFTNSYSRDLLRKCFTGTFDISAQYVLQCQRLEGGLWVPSIHDEQLASRSASPVASSTMQSSWLSSSFGPTNDPTTEPLQSLRVIRPYELRLPQNTSILRNFNFCIDDYVDEEGWEYCKVRVDA